MLIAYHAFFVTLNVFEYLCYMTTTPVRIQRKIQFRQGSYVVTIPHKIVKMVGIKNNQYVTFAVSNDTVILKPTNKTITKKDVTEANKDSAHFDTMEKNPRYMKELATALKRSTDDDDAAAVEPSKQSTVVVEPSKQSTENKDENRDDDDDDQQNKPKTSKDAEQSEMDNWDNLDSKRKMEIAFERLRIK